MKNKKSGKSSSTGATSKESSPLDTIKSRLTEALLQAKNGKPTQVPLSEIKVVGAAIRPSSPELLGILRERLHEAPATVDPVVAVQTPDGIVLVDGRVRLEAANLEGCIDLAVIIVDAEPSVVPALAFELNRTHGQPLNRLQIREAVAAAIRANKDLAAALVEQVISASRVAEMFKVSESTIRRIADDFKAEDENVPSKTRSKKIKGETVKRKKADSKTSEVETPAGVVPAPKDEVADVGANDNHAEKSTKPDESAVNNDAPPLECSEAQQLTLAREFIRLAAELAAIWAIEPEAAYKRATELAAKSA